MVKVHFKMCFFLFFYLTKLGDVEEEKGTRSITDYTYESINTNLEQGIFAVEFGTTVTFAISNTAEGIFTYTYTFTFNGETVAKVKYEMEESKYVMQYNFNEANERVSIANGLNGAFNTDSHPFNEPPTLGELSSYDNKEISPAFGLRQIWGSLA